MKTTTKSGSRQFTVTGAADGNVKYTVEQLQLAFLLVQNPGGWKHPIRRQEISLDALSVTAEAIRYFTASATRVTITADCRCFIEAPGYYATIGA